MKPIRTISPQEPESAHPGRWELAYNERSPFSASFLSGSGLANSLEFQGLIGSKFCLPPLVPTPAKASPMNGPFRDAGAGTLGPLATMGPSIPNGHT